MLLSFSLVLSHLHSAPCECWISHASHLAFIWDPTLFLYVHQTTWRLNETQSLFQIGHNSRQYGTRVYVFAAGTSQQEWFFCCLVIQFNHDTLRLVHNMTLGFRFCPQQVQLRLQTCTNESDKLKTIMLLALLLACRDEAIMLKYSPIMLFHYASILSNYSLNNSDYSLIVFWLFPENLTSQQCNG